MIYSVNILTPENTPIIEPKKTIIKLSRGLIYQFDIYFPPGSSGLMGIAVFEVNHQLYPFNTGSFFLGDNVTLTYPDLHELTEEQNELTIHTYNLDTDYEHLLQVRFGLVARTDFQSAFVPSFSFDDLNTTMENLNITMDALKVSNTKKSFKLFRTEV